MKYAIGVFCICFSIVASAVVGIFMLKNYPQTKFDTNYGSVNLGQVYSESVRSEISLYSAIVDQEEYELTKGSFFEREANVTESMESLFSRIFKESPESEKIKYVDSKLTADAKLKVVNKIFYGSSNFNGFPYEFTVTENTYVLKKDENLKKQIDAILQKDFEVSKAEIANRLYITDPVEHGLPPKTP